MSQDTIQQILNRIDIVEIVGEFVKLKKRGTSYLGLCPFHNEKTPSFTVSPTKEIFKCFGCGRSGNSIGFLMDHEKYSYVEALRWLAARYNVQIEETETSPEYKQQQQVADSLYIINGFAQKFFTEQLFNTDEGQDIALSYLKERGFDEAILQKFQVGYSPKQSNAFTSVALKAQYSLENLQKSGLVAVRDGNSYDNYRGRIIFPVHNQTGKIIGFGARVIGSSDRGPKYINTPENELYIKSKILYGSYFARHAIDKEDECLLVEGYTDVVSLHRAGIENVVASGGTSLTPDQLRLVKKYTNNLTIVYDGDNAGIKAALRGLDLALEEGLNVKLVLIPDKEDPDSYVNKIGAVAFREFVKTNKKDFVIFQLEVSLKDAGNDTQRKAEAVNQVAETISRINKVEDFSRQQDYIRKSAAMLNIEEQGLLNLVNKIVRDKITKQENKQSAEDQRNAEAAAFAPTEDDDTLALLNKDELQERGMVRILLEYGTMPWDDDMTVAEYILEEQLDESTIHNPELIRIIETYKVWYNEGLNPGPKNFLYHEDRSVSTLVLSIMDFPYEISHNWTDQFETKIKTTEEIYRDEVTSTLSYLKLRKIRKMIEDNQRDLEKPHTTEEQMMLIQTHQHLKKMEKDLLMRTGTVILK
ncbi:MAG: DNA primase [Flavitalea sp.]